MNVRRAVDANIGRRVRVRANKGRHKYSVAEGVIQESYPSIFTVRIAVKISLKERFLQLHRCSDPGCAASDLQVGEYPLMGMTDFI
ncbi:MAG: Veg family protein [Coprococcus sp.]